MQKVVFADNCWRVVILVLSFLLTTFSQSLTAQENTPNRFNHSRASGKQPTIAAQAHLPMVVGSLSDIGSKVRAIIPSSNIYNAIQSQAGFHLNNLEQKNRFERGTRISPVRIPASEYSRPPISRAHLDILGVPAIKWSKACGEKLSAVG